jgi:BirA family biotin operon repressor/biotin-[acetyl-CoA-carboxylase] ligase
MFFTNLFQANLKVKNIAKNIIYYTSTQSTSDDIWDLYKNESTIQTLVITDNQTQGKGRSNNIWFSKPSHSITCSFLLDQIFEHDKINLHAILIPVAIVKGVKKFLSIDLYVKWPNDIMFNNKKLGGILIESKIKNNAYFFNVGIGLNVNEDNFDFPKHLQKNSISLKEIKGHPIQREPLLASILNELDSYIEKKNDDNLIQDWMNYCIHINQDVEFKYKGEKVNGIFKLINNKGQAVIKHNNNYIEYDGAITIL